VFNEKFDNSVSSAFVKKQLCLCIV